MSSKRFFAVAAMSLAFILASCAEHSIAPFGDYMAPIVPEYYDLADTAISDFEGILDFYAWDTSSDAVNGGNSVGSNVWNAAGKNGSSLRFQYRLGTAGPAYMSSRKGDNYFLWRSDDLRLDGSAYDGICFWVRGSGSKLRVNVCTMGSYYNNSNSISSNYQPNYNWDFWGKEITTPAEWTLCFLNFNRDLKRKGFDTRPAPLDLTWITEFEFQASSGIRGEIGWFEIDDFYFYKEE